MRWKQIFWMIGIMVLLFPGTSRAQGQEDWIVFTQVTPEGKTLYVGDPEGRIEPVVTGKTLAVFLEKRHFLYFVDRKLYEYDPDTRQGRLVTPIDESRIYLRCLPDGPDQAVIVGLSDYYQTNYYVLEFEDNNLRRVPPFPFVPSTSSSGKISQSSPDSQNRATIRAGAGRRFELTIEAGTRSKWVLSKDMTALPELPRWSPDSQKLAFYTKPESYEGFYSLYLLDLSKPKLEMELVQAQVFPKYFFSDSRSGGFEPRWSADSRFLVFTYLPFGLPTESSILKYDTGLKRKEVILNSPGENYYPKLSDGGDRLLFYSNRENQQFQLYLYDLRTKTLQRVSSSPGEVDWAEWYRFD